MAKEIWLGPVLGNNRERLLRRCAGYVSQGQAERLLYIAASHPLLDLVTDKLLDGKQGHGVWGEFPVYLFRGLVRRILSGAIVSEARPRGPQPGSPAGVGRSGRASSVTEPLLMRGLLTPELRLPPRVPIDREELPLRKSLISQIIKQLSAAGRLRAVKPLAHREGCVNTIASLIGELQRAGKTPEEFQRAVEERAAESGIAEQVDLQNSSPRSQLDFDREVALIYAAYAEALDRFNLTDEDADQLRALQVLHGEVGGRAVSLPWLDQVELLVLDGFFDFTPVQGEILKQLIPIVPNVIVNLNGDSRNTDIFRPFQSTIEHLESVANFEITTSEEVAEVCHELAPLRERLFNVGGDSSPIVREGSLDGDEAQAGMPAVRPQDAGVPSAGTAVMLIECGDREVEIRAIAKEIKRLVLTNGYQLSEIALVVRQRAAYADTILRVCADESIPANLERRVEAVETPAMRACGKLFQLLKQPSREEIRNPKTSELAHLIKTGYFRPSAAALPELTLAFDNQYAGLLAKHGARTSRGNQTAEPDEQRRVERLRAELGIGRWPPDLLENVIAYVGTELRVDAWTERARRLIDMFPSPEAARSLIAGSAAESEDAAIAAADESPPDEPPVRRRKPSPIHPAAIAWAVILIEHLQGLLSSLPTEATAEELRGDLMSLLDQLEFAKQVKRSFNETEPAGDVPQAALDVRGLESLRRALAAAVRSFGYAARIVSEALPGGPQRGNPAEVGRSGRATVADSSLTAGLVARTNKAPHVTLSSFIDEVERSLRSQVLAIGAANRDGLQVLEATDVRGLRFRAVFIAGLLESGFPLRTSRDWLYPHEERLRLQKHGIFLEDISTDTLLKEEHYFYQAACRATERLYLTRPLATAAVSETVASYYIEELKRVVDPDSFGIEQVRGDLDTRELMQSSTGSELSTFLVRQSQQRAKTTGGKRDLSQAQIEDLLARAETHGYISNSAVRRVVVERERNSLLFGSRDGEITNPDLRALLRRHFGPEHVHSASGLSTYGNCSFRFFAARVLRLEPRSEAALDLQAIDAGKLLHDILRRFFEGHRKQYLPDLNREDLRRQMSQTADDVFREHETLVPPLSQRIWKIDCEIRKLILDQVLLYELRLQEKTKGRGIRPAYFELAFGRASQASDPSSSPDYLKFERDALNGSESALLQGQIDRVDVNERDGVAVAYDYKLSQGARFEDIETGRQVQIPIYLAALEQLFLPGYQLAGGGYYKLKSRGPRLNQGVYRTMFRDCTDTTRTTHVDDVKFARLRAEVEKKVWEFIDGMRGGHFRVRPSLGKTTCKFCDYSAVCRYEPYRISQKRG
ncbi:MAG: ATP-dependent helicase/nuclease subunit [Blastocatellia bacterium]|nr:ATP-dependent helicase/nuclease subunit [Blastocatellia bacterium]